MVRFPPGAGAPVISARVRACPEDFVVEERCPVVPDPAGEHLWIRVRKRGWNTADAARVLARAAGLRIREVGYSGLKDRNAVATQWFSLWLRRRPEPRFDRLPDGLEVLERVRCVRKLRRGMHTGNRFVIRLREADCTFPRVEARLEQIAREGFPNYFGPQRFGRNFRNVTRAARLFRASEPEPNRHLRGLWISAARAWIFNHVLARRVDSGCWRRLIDGDVPDAEGLPTGPLWGEGEAAVSGAAAALEAAVAARFAALRDGLARTRMPPGRRPLVAQARELCWEYEENQTASLRLDFVLPPGVYATALLAELVGEAAARGSPTDCYPARPQNARRSSTYKAPVPPSTGRAEV